MAERLVGALTFVFTDIEGSTQRGHALGTERWGDVLRHHAEIIRAVVAHDTGVEVRTEGDSFFLVFPSARQAVAAAADAQRALASHKWPHGARVRVRMGLHTGEEAAPGTPEMGTDYLGYDVHRAARVSAAAQGGQVLLSTTTKALLGDNLPSGVTLRDLGEYRLKDLSQPDRLYQLVIEGLPDAFPPLRTLLAMGTFPRALTPLVGREREIGGSMPSCSGRRCASSRLPELEAAERPAWRSRLLPDYGISSPTGRPSSHWHPSSTPTSCSSLSRAHWACSRRAAGLSLRA